MGPFSNHSWCAGDCGDGGEIRRCDYVLQYIVESAAGVEVWGLQEKSKEVKIIIDAARKV